MKAKHIDLHWLHMMHLPRLHRPFSKRGRKHTIACSLGCMVMLAGSGLSVLHLDVVLPHVVWDMLAYFIHGCGAIPIVKHIEPLWMMLVE
jgi:hypothetical protein